MTFSVALQEDRLLLLVVHLLATQKKKKKKKKKPMMILFEQVGLGVVDVVLDVLLAEGLLEHIQRKVLLSGKSLVELSALERPAAVLHLAPHLCCLQNMRGSSPFRIPSSSE